MNSVVKYLQLQPEPYRRVFDSDGWPYPLVPFVQPRDAVYWTRAISPSSAPRGVFVRPNYKGRGVLARVVCAR